jgi:hypothetical protein
VHSQLKQAHRVAREKFDLDEAMAALPPQPQRTPTPKGAAGYRLRAQERADISDDLLREFARDTLGAVRTSAQYLDALRVVLGNQAHAERNGYTLEMNVRTTFATPRVMRSIIDQMQAADITTSRRVSLGGGHTQVVQVYEPPTVTYGGAQEELEAMLRAEERATDRGLRGKVWGPKKFPVIISADEVPY